MVTSNHAHLLLKDTGRNVVVESMQLTPVGGLGIHLTRKLMGGIEYQRLEDRNLLTMKKNIEARGEVKDKGER